MWAIGVYDLRLSEDWMDRLTVQEFDALRERQAEEFRDKVLLKTGKRPKKPDKKPANFNNLVTALRLKVDE